MSFFGQDPADFTAGDDCSVHDTELDTEIEDGVLVERRSVLRLSAAAVTSLLFAGSSLRGQEPQGSAGGGSSGKSHSNKLSFDEFLTTMLPMARRIVESKGEDEEAYLLTVAAALTRLQDPAAPLRKAMQEFRKANGKSGERFPLGVMAMQLKPGRGFSHHDHLNYNGVIFGVEGEVRIRNYDFQGKPPAIDSGETFQIRETRDDLILPGRISTLGANRDNVHDLVAGKDGARVLDVFTFFDDRAASRYLDVEAKPRDADARIYDAAWRPRRKRRQRK